MRFLRALFLKKTTLPSTRNSEQSLTGEKNKILKFPVTELIDMIVAKAMNVNEKFDIVKLITKNIMLLLKQIMTYM